MKNAVASVALVLSVALLLACSAPDEREAGAESAAAAGPAFACLPPVEGESALPESGDCVPLRGECPACPGTRPFRCSGAGASRPEGSSGCFSAAGPDGLPAACCSPALICPRAERARSLCGAGLVPRSCDGSGPPPRCSLAGESDGAWLFCCAT